MESGRGEGGEEGRWGDREMGEARGYVSFDSRFV